MGAREVKTPPLPEGFEPETETAPIPEGFEIEKPPEEKKPFFAFNPKDKNRGLLHALITEAVQGHAPNAIEPINAAHLLAAPAVADAVPAVVNGVRALGAATAGGSAWHAGGAMLRRLLGGGH